MKKKQPFLCALYLLFIQSLPLLASSTGGAPWETPLTQMVNMLQGPVATSLSVMALIGVGVSLMFFEVGRAFRWLLSVVLGCSLIISASGFLSLLGLSSALL